MKKSFLTILGITFSIILFAQENPPCSGLHTITTGYNEGLLTSGQIDNNWKVVGTENSTFTPPLNAQTISNPNGFGSLNVDPDGDGSNLYNNGIRYESNGEFHEMVEFESQFCLSSDVGGVSINITAFASAYSEIYLNNVQIAAHSSTSADETVPINVTYANTAGFNIGGVNTISVKIWQVNNQSNPASLYTFMLNANISVSIGCIEDCSAPPPCELPSFEANEKYWISAWVNVNSNQQVISYTKSASPSTAADGPHIKLSYTGSTGIAVTFFPEGEIIDGWQRIAGEFTVPGNATDISLELISDATFDTYFDDVRFHPFNASMKSYVYDGETFWLTSELDDNNYATFYEYDNEGGLIRIKKETARGVVTIQETRSGTRTE